MRTALRRIARPASLGMAHPPDGSPVTLFGYGCTRRNTSLGSGQKRKFEFPQGAATARLCPGDSGGPLYKATPDGVAVVGVNANYTLLPDDKDEVGIPVTNWHTRLDGSSRNHVGDWLSQVGVP
mgnify:CR=1 FL=1